VTKRGRVDVVTGMRSASTSSSRTLRVYTPPDYDGSGHTTYPVLVMLDGQNLFARSRGGPMGTWAIDETMDALVGDGAIPPWIVVGVDHRHADRIADDSPWADPRFEDAPRGAEEAAFVALDLEEWILARLPAAPGPNARALAGSSLGGLLALYVAWRHPDAFSRVGAFSPSVMWSNGELSRRWTARAASPARLYLDAGIDERFDGGSFTLDYGASAIAFAAQLRGLGYGDETLRVVLEPGGRHDEDAWARRFGPAARWLLASKI
jgi:enterochelin esterase-like enzyme